MRPVCPAVVLCSDLAGDGLDLGDVGRALCDPTCPGLAVTIVEHLCDRPTAAAAAMRAAGSSRAVVGVCRRHVPAAGLRARARRNGSDAFDVAIVRVPRTRGAAAATSTIAAAVGRLAAMPTGEPSRKVAIQGGRSRGALLRLAPAVSLEPVAAVEADRCVGVSRCGLCAATCPTGAIAAGEGAARVTTADCTACGRCLAACPTGAIRLSACSERQIEAQLAGLLDGPASRVVLACTAVLDVRGDAPGLDDWALVEVPALAIVTPGWVAQTLLAGASHVWLYPCDGECCAPWREQGGRRELTRHLLGTALSERFTVADAAPPVAPGRRTVPAAGADRAGGNRCGARGARLLSRDPAPGLTARACGRRPGLHDLRRMRGGLPDDRSHRHRGGGGRCASARPTPMHGVWSVQPGLPRARASRRARPGLGPACSRAPRARLGTCAPVP